MGLLGNVLGGTYNAAARRLAGGGWQPDGTGITSGGDCGGDIQAGDAYSVRLVHPDHLCSLITVTFYPVEYEETPGEFVVQRQVEWLICEDPADPGGTEIWSDEARDDPFGQIFDTADEAGADARDAAQDVLGNPWVYTWNGQPR